ncbi:MAG: SusC/RagA family TonB-linked outer membrane protein [Dysgonamonadaceae bacterium]|jgi:TonB-linked SusC/RagA family outer membrane protein|nr:SusC/RagA family TonB-linked outer membrane protein [Dysgonamonadaceae bacterium]
MKEKLSLIKKCGMIALLIAFSLSAAAQNITVRGIVIDELDEPVIGATIQIKGTTQGTATDISGNFTVSAPAGATLVISYIGYQTQEVAASENVSVKLESDSEMLDEIVVIGFGEQRRSAFTGSATVVTASDIALRPITNVMSALEGMASGIQMQSVSSAPGSDPSFRIRGVSSISAGRDPLIVVDGVPFERGLNDINPNDVESITVLKDAASIAIYGARGGNGVILVTTKRPRRAEGVSVSVNSRVAASRVRMSDLYDVIRHPGEFYEQHYAAMFNYFQGLGFNAFEANREANSVWTNNSDRGGVGYLVYTVPDGQLLIGQNGRLNPNATLGRVVRGVSGDNYLQMPDDWISETFGTGYQQDHNISIRGGSEKMTLMFAGGYTKEIGITQKADFERFTGRIRGSFDVNRWFKVNASMNASMSTQNHDTDFADNSNNIFSNAIRMAPIYPLFIRDINGNIMHDENGKMYDYGDGTFNDGIARPINTGSNRLQEALLQTRNTTSARFGAQFETEFKLTPHLSVTLNNNYDERNRRSKNTGQPFYGSSNPGGYVSINHRGEPTVTLQQLVNYSRQFNDHSVRGVLLHEYYKTDFLYLYGRRDNMFSYFENQELSGAVTIVGANSYSRPYQNEGYGGRLMYDYRGIYHADASYRRDASSRFHPDHQWGNFFSFGGAYMISNEDFFNVSWVDQLKLKASYGQNGNDQIGSSYSRYQDAFLIEGIDGEISLTFHQRGNENMTWETRTAINTGAEFTLFNRRLTGSVDFYNNITSNMLSSVSVPSSLGYSTYWDNVGSMRNRGLEVELRGTIIHKRDFSWSAYINTSFNKSKIIELAPQRTGEDLINFDGSLAAVGYSSGSFFMGEGLEFRTWRLRKFAGINDEGRPMWYRRDNETGETSTTTVYSDGTFYASGSSQPKLLGGFGTNLGWKDLHLNLAFAYRLGGYAMDSGYQTLMQVPNTSRTGFNFHRDTYNSWTAENPNNSYARWMFDDRSSFTSASDRWLSKADYLSLQNVTVGYNLPRKIAQQLDVQGVSVSLGVDNPFILTARRGFIPTRDFDGALDFGYYPEMTRYTFNLNISF